MNFTRSFVHHLKPFSFPNPSVGSKTNFNKIKVIANITSSLLCHVISLTALFLNYAQATQWTRNDSTEWDDDGNWNGNVPDENTNAIINTMNNAPVISSLEAEANNTTIDSSTHNYRC